MRILAPVDRAAEAEGLIGAGAGALYLGYVPRSWLEGHSDLESFNRRTFREAQFTDIAEVEALAAAARARGVPLWATLNAAYYPPSMYEPVMEAARSLAAAGVAGFIVSDIPLILRLREEGLGELALSTMAGVFNSEAARFWGAMGLTRVTLPRDLSTAEVTAIALANPGMAFDVFAMFGACANAESFCRWVHDDPARVWPCVKKYLPSGGRAAGGGAVAAQLGWSGLNRAFACGLCSLADLAGIPNLEGLKVVGRGAPTARKLAGVAALREMLDAVEAGEGRAAILARARRLRERLDPGPCNPYLCYYPEYL